MNEPIKAAEDPRLDPYRSLKTATLQRKAGLFIAEGDKVVERLLESDFEVISILVSERRAAAFRHLADSGIELLAVTDRLASQLVGFKFHAGVMACGRRKPSPGLADLASSSRLLVGCSRVDDPENLGSIIRLCAVFGIDGLVLGPGCADPFSRRVLRVSMGNAFRLPIAECRDLATDLQRLKSDFGFQVIATVADERAEPIESAPQLSRAIILFGNEAHGLEPDLIALSDRRLTIPMRSGTDSLNVAVAAGITLYELDRHGTRRIGISGHNQTHSTV
jgi:tRNA G18 (ribose-2'-O)-methylase SpoU